MNKVSELAIDYLQRYNCQVSEDYKTLLREACNLNPPPHGKAWYGKLYRQYSRDAEWFANSLITNATEEGNGAREVWQFANHIGNQQFAELVRSHAIDESRHSKMFVALLNMIFPTKIEADFRTELQALSPEYYHHKHPSIEPVSAEQVLDEKRVMDEIIQINLLEIRALILQLLLRPVLQAYATPENLPRVTRMSDLLIYDETKHIEYSGYCIGKYMEQGDACGGRSLRTWVREMMIYRQKTVNEMFLEDVELESSVGKTVLTTQ
ncbi:hypothetical protein NIES2100_18970 [Calothrix sp. NIES-2100]|uniref:hypothetical protein n=1 Tax=Calothrix sp. NIES-2100 TaxID=1954172 RepID=UPI000B61AF23|nr:hypothetical protein NIES2100_18970 [Calothrix sp. NIES-2100]